MRRRSGYSPWSVPSPEDTLDNSGPAKCAALHPTGHQRDVRCTIRQTGSLRSPKDVRCTISEKQPHECAAQLPKDFRKTDANFRHPTNVRRTISIGDLTSVRQPHSPETRHKCARQPHEQAPGSVCGTPSPTGSLDSVPLPTGVCGALDRQAPTGAKPGSGKGPGKPAATLYAPLNRTPTPVRLPAQPQPKLSASSTGHSSPGRRTAALKAHSQWAERGPTLKALPNRYRSRQELPPDRQPKSADKRKTRKRKLGLR